MAKAKRVVLNLQCTSCKSINYTTEKNPLNAAQKAKGNAEKLLLNKFCKVERKVTPHKEVKI